MMCRDMSTTIFNSSKECGNLLGMSETKSAAAIKETTASNDNPSSVSTQIKPPKDKAKMPKLRLKDQMFVTEYLRNGHNAARAYLNTKSNSKVLTTAYTEGPKNLRKPHIREAVEAAMVSAGVDEYTVSHRVAQQLRHEDPWICNEGIKHSCKILGLYAPTESHLQVDKRSVTVTLSAEDSKALLKDLMKKSK